jgi:hypothetical protein
MHLRWNDELDMKALNVQGAQMVREWPEFSYRIYRFDVPMAPGERRTVSFDTVLEQRGFRLGGNTTRIVDNGTFVTNQEFAPIIGMDRNGTLQDRAKRRKFGLPAELRPARLEDLGATGRNYIGADWVTTDVTVTTDADQTPLAPGYQRSDVTRDGRRTVRFVTESPVLYFLSVQSARYEIARRMHNGVEMVVYHDARHGRNVDRMMTALATFGIIGVGASELMVYPYWCLEKGYGVAVGPRDDSEAWAVRARGWLKVMQLDAWASMVVYTTVTVAFYLLGAATLGRLGLQPEGGEMVRTLGAMYTPVFGPVIGPWANSLFLVGAFAVLYSTLFVAAAGNARMVVDGLILAGILPGDDASRTAWNRRLSTAWPLVAMVLALAIREPVAMVLASGMAQAVMLAALGVAVLWFRWRALDPRLRPGPAWDTLLVISSLGFMLIGSWTLWERVTTLLRAAG